MKTKYFIAALATVALASCKQELKPQESSSAQEVTAPTASQTSMPQDVPVNSQPQPADVQSAMQPTPQATQPPVKVANGMNPPHGQPGHRCEIAVGAPLNSSSGASNATNATPMTVTPAQPGSAVAKEITPGAPALLNTSTPSATPTAPGMNPPHGQPGHRCEIAVGAPLN